MMGYLKDARAMFATSVIVLLLNLVVIQKVGIDQLKYKSKYQQECKK